MLQCFSNKINIFFAPENMKKPPSKVAHNWPNFFFGTDLAAQTAQIQKSYANKSPLMQDWVFRLGNEYKLETCFSTLNNFLAIRFKSGVFNSSLEHGLPGISGLAFSASSSYSFKVSRILLLLLLGI